MIFSSRLTSRVSLLSLAAKRRRGHTIRMSSNHDNITSNKKVKQQKRRADHLELTANNKRQTENILEAEIVSIRNLSPSVKGFSLKLIQENDETHKITPTFKAGQWLDLFLAELSTVSGYSMTSSPSTLSTSNIFELAIKSTNFAPTKWMITKAKEGHRVQVRFGGDFHYPNPIIASNPDHSLLLIAGGVGINPLISIMRHINDLLNDTKNSNNDKCSPIKTHLLYSSRTESELIFREDIEEIKNKHPNHFKVDFFVTGENEENCNLGFQNRRIDSNDINLALKKLDDHKNGKIFCYICGPPPFLETTRSILKELGKDEREVFHESWW